MVVPVWTLTPSGPVLPQYDVPSILRASHAQDQWSSTSKLVTESTPPAPVVIVHDMSLPYASGKLGERKHTPSTTVQSPVAVNTGYRVGLTLYVGLADGFSVGLGEGLTSCMQILNPPAVTA